MNKALLFLILFFSFACSSNTENTSSSTDQASLEDDSTVSLEDDSTVSLEDDNTVSLENDNTISLIEIQSIDPSDGSTEVSRNKSISITFNKPIDNNTFTLNYTDMECRGSVLISMDGFQSCVQLSGPPLFSEDKKTVTMTPLINFYAKTIYRIYVDNSLFKDEDGFYMQTPWVSTNGFTTSGTTIAQLGGSGGDVSYNIEIDSENNIYISGKGRYIDGNRYSNNSFISKYDNTLKRLWTKQFVLDSASSISIDSNDELLLTTSNIHNPGIYTLNSDGGILNKSGSIFLPSVYRFCISDINKNENLFVGFYYSDSYSCSIDSYSRSLVISKVHDNGTIDWVRSIDGQSIKEEVTSVTTDSNGYIYITGNTSRSLNGELYNNGGDVFIAMLDPNGNIIWLKLIGSEREEISNDIAIDKSKNIYITGYTEGIIGNVESSGERDVFLAKYSNTGNLQWVRQIGNTHAEGKSLAIDSKNYIYLIGYSFGDFDSNKNIGSSDIVIAKYNTEGDKLWAKQYGTLSEDYGEDIAIDKSDNIFVTGYTYGNFYGNINMGGSDAFIMKIDTEGVIQ